MARRWQGRKSLAALVTLAMLDVAMAGCGMADTGADAQTRGEATPIRLVRTFMSGNGDTLAALRDAGAKVDTTFAGSGSYPFEIPAIALKGSALAIDGSHTSAAPETLTIVLPPEPRLTFDEAQAALGKATRAPGLPGKPWHYLIATPQGRYSIGLSGDPEKAAARVTELTAIRER